MPIKTVGCESFDTTETHAKPFNIRPEKRETNEKYLHNRFILTENGGLIFATGLDDHDDSEHTHDIVDLLEPEPHAKTWQEYQRESSTFTFIDSLIIEGTAA